MRKRKVFGVGLQSMGAILGMTVLMLTVIGVGRSESPEFSGQATVTYVPLSGGFFGLVTEGGEQYLPLNLDPEFQIDGLRVVFTAEQAPDVMTVFMWGTPIRLLSLQPVPDDASLLASANVAFALALYDQVRARQEGNLIISPLSVSAALAMTLAGARGETAQQMADVLGLAPLLDRFPSAFAELLDDLDGEGAPYDLSIAHSLWGQKGYGFLGTFIDLARTQFGADVQEVDFSADPDAARREINGWVAERTRDRIAELLSQGTVDASTRLVLVNALYLLAAWESPFLPENTSVGWFTPSSGEPIAVPLMSQTAMLPYACLDTVQVVELAYEGGDLSLLIALPRAGISLSEVESALTPETVTGWAEALESTNVTVHLPPFRLRTALSLRDLLQEMGMPLAFSDRADFSGLAGRADLTIDDVVHESFIDVDERGTEAAAATAVVIRGTSLPQEPVSFRADRPFLFLLRDRNTGTILFMGRVENPS